MAPAEAPPDAVEVALARAIADAAAAGQWAAVATVAAELEARRLARLENVVPIRPRVKSAP
ncbi:MAG: hypothetical protein U0169_02005 [Polyangiaceae bacterium]